jgi:hypothetical protein
VLLLNTQLIPQDIKDYLQNPRKIISIIPNDNFTLTIKFDNDEIRIYDMNDKLFGVFEILKDLNKFKEVFIDESGNVAWNKDTSIDSNICWNNRIDICKDSIYLDSKPTSLTP